MCQKINKQNDITETGMGDKSWQHFNKNIQGITHTKSLGKNFPGVEIVDVNPTRQKRHWFIQETKNSIRIISYRFEIIPKGKQNLLKGLQQKNNII